MASTVTIDLRHVARGLDFPLRQVQAVVELLGRRKHGSLHHPLPQGPNGRPGRGADSRNPGPPGQDAAAGRSQADDPAVDRGPGQADRKAGQANPRRHDDQAAGRPLSARSSRRSRPWPRSRGPAAWRSWPRRFSRRPPRPSTLTPGPATSPIRTARCLRAPMLCWAQDISWPSSSASGPTCGNGSGKSCRRPARSSPRKSWWKPRPPSRMPMLRQKRQPPIPRLTRSRGTRSGSATGSAAVSQEETTTVQPTAEAIEAPAAEAMSEATTPEASQPAEVPAVETPEAPAAAVEVVDIVAEMAPSPENVEPASGVADDNIEHPAPTASSESEAASGETSEIAAAAAAAAAPPPLAAAAARRAARTRARQGAKAGQERSQEERPTNAASRPSATTSTTPKTSRRSRRIACWRSIAANRPRCCA